MPEEKSVEFTHHQSTYIENLNHVDVAQGHKIVWVLIK